MKQPNILPVLIVIFLNLLSVNTKSQVLNIDDPIRSLDYFYDEDNNLQVMLLMNVDKSGEVDNNTIPNIKLQAVVNWETEPSNIDEKNIEVYFNKESSSDYIYSAVLKTKNKKRIKKPDKNMKWKSITDVRIIVDINNQSQEFPRLNFYHIIPSKVTTNYKLKASREASIIGDNKVVIALQTEPQGLACELTSLTISRNGTNHNVNIGSIGNGKFGYNGVFTVVVQLPYSLTENDFKILATAKRYDTNAEIKCKETIVRFVDNKAPMLKYPETVYLTNEVNKTINVNVLAGDKNINNFGIEFISKEFQNIQHIKSQEGSIIHFELSKLENLPKKYTYFWFTYKNERKFGPCLLVKQVPVVTNFKFDATQDKKTGIFFDLPAWVEKNDVKIGIDQNIDLKNDNIKITKKGNENSPSKFQVDLNENLFSKLRTDTVINARLSVLVDDEPRYDLQVSFVNQTLINEKIKKLIELSGDKKPDQKKEEIKKVLEDIVEIASKLGQTVKNEDVQKAVKDLAGKNNKEKTEKVMKVIADVGKWVTTIGPIVIPLLI